MTTSIYISRDNVLVSHHNRINPTIAHSLIHANMKADILILASVATFISSTQACITVHSYFRTYFGPPDHLELQVKDNGVEVCRGGQSVELSSTDTEWCVDENNGCNPGYKVCVTDNGKRGYVESK